MTCGYYRTSSPVTALPMIMRWISDVPSKMVKILEPEKRLLDPSGRHKIAVAPFTWASAA